jgi:hypothetical protein
MGELKMTGNSLRGSRPLLSFDKSFEEMPQYQVLRELLVQTFGTPNQHPKSQPFYDHVITFTVMDNRIWFRNYQIVTEDGSLAEIGNLFVLFFKSSCPTAIIRSCLSKYLDNGIMSSIYIGGATIILQLQVQLSLSSWQNLCMQLHTV